MKEDSEEYILVDNHENMDLVIRSLACKPQIAIDTEFVRISTLHPIVALVQLNDGENTFLVDPIMLDKSEMDRFWRALVESDSLFIFFAMHEDLDLINFYAEKLPKNIVDLQWMAGFVGSSVKLGLAAVIKNFLDITILKDQTTSIWMQRPLTHDQLRYGAVDVKYLIQLYELMKQKIDELSNTDLFNQDLKLQIEHAIVPFDPRLGYLKYHADSMTAAERAKLREIVNFRQKIAENENVCLKFIVPNRLLVPLCQKTIKNVISLQKMGLHWKSIRDYSKDLLNILNRKYTQADFDGILDHQIPVPEFRSELAEKIAEVFKKFSRERNIDCVVTFSQKRVLELIIYLGAPEADREYLEYPLILCSKWRYDLIKDLLQEYFPDEPVLQKLNQQEPEISE